MPDSAPRLPCPSDDPLAGTPAEALARAEAFGVDLSLVREALRMTPEQRIERNSRMAAFAQALREAGLSPQPT